MSAVYRVATDKIIGPNGPTGLADTSTAESGSGWPPGWRERAYALQSEAVAAGASDEEIAAVRGWMLDPELQVIWDKGKPPAERLKELEGIEIGARAWLRARGKMVKARG